MAGRGCLATASVPVIKVGPLLYEVVLHNPSSARDALQAYRNGGQQVTTQLHMTSVTVTRMKWSLSNVCTFLLS